MFKILSYPRCAKSFMEFCVEADKHVTNKSVFSILRVKPFDVSLRDGLQGLSKEKQLTMKPIDKINLYFKIKEKYNPPHMEIGSIVSSKVLPIFKDSDSLHNYIEYCQFTSLQEPDEPKTNNFILVPNEKQFNDISKFISLSCFSFITSVSESFQMKNTKMTLDTTFQQLNNMMRILDDKPEKSTVKLYVSCINECPIEGKIDNNIIIGKILKYQELKPDILCLSDTCGTLTVQDIEYILSNLTKEKSKNISLHLHVKPGREDEVEEIIHTALDFGITSFDVSAIETGGCSVTMNHSDLAPNLSYELYYKSLATYLLK